jgi:SAM-dependent methyltransferase
MEEYEYAGSELDVFALATNWKRYFARLLEPFIDGSVLEVGAGLGETTRALYNNRVTRWVCLEPDRRLAERLTHQGFDKRPQPEVVVGDISALAPDERFDTIVYIDVLEHIKSDGLEVRSAASRLAPGGHLIVLAPACQFLLSQFDRAIGHERRYTRRTLAAVFPHDLEEIKVFYADSIGMLLSLANRLLLQQAIPSARQVLFWDRFIVPLSRMLDPVVRRSFGRSVIAIFRAPRAMGPLG